MLLFQPHHYAAFNPPKSYQDDPATRGERETVRDALLELHGTTWPLIGREKLDLHHHWQPDHIVSMTHFVPHVVEHIDAMWLSYGKSKYQIGFLKRELGSTLFHGSEKVENFDASFLHIRIQCFINASAFRCWLAMHKSCIDRSNFLDTKLKDKNGRDKFWELVRPLFDKGFFYELRDVTVEPNKHRKLPLVFELSQQELIKFVKQDRDGFYSGIAKEYQPSDPALDVSRIRDEMIANIRLLYPLYDFMAWRPGRR